jgi:hypothetical protein
LTTKAKLLQQIETERAYWNDLVGEVGEDRMEQPGPMGAWTFKDLTAHITGWRNRTIDRIEAGPGSDPAPAWPNQLTEDDEINDWIYVRNRNRPLQRVLADADLSFKRLAAAVRALPEEDLTTPGRFSWLDGAALVHTDFFGHLHAEHEPSIRAWLATQYAQSEHSNEADAASEPW